MARHFGQGGRYVYRSKIEQPDDQDFSVTLRTSGAVGANLAASTAYSYTITYLMHDGSQTPAPTAKSVTQGATPYPIDIYFKEVEDDMPGEAKAMRIYKNGKVLKDIAKGTISFVDDGNVASGTAVPPTSNATSYGIINHTNDRLVIPVGTNKYAT